MPAPSGTVVDCNTIQKKLGRLKKLLGENDVAAYQALSTEIVANLGTVDTTIQASSDKSDLSASPQLSIDTFA